MLVLCLLVIQFGCHWSQLKATYLLTYLYHTSVSVRHIPLGLNCDCTRTAAGNREKHHTFIMRRFGFPIYQLLLWQHSCWDDKRFIQCK